ncbi:MAG: RNase adapter RapZ [Desulfobulbus oligotrophicus]|jgi:UPF0042 nucleotide-binding protein|nr:RNase adapter RapZ [Desulfobulbus oligotrophicus]
MKITLSSFGFKHQYLAADLVWDVRFLPNPFWDPVLRPLNGLQSDVAHYVLESDPGKRFLTLVEPLFLFLVDAYTDQERPALTVAIGCTGGKHRSVAVVEHLSAFLRAHDRYPVVFHRDIDKE